MLQCSSLCAFAINGDSVVFRPRSRQARSQDCKFGGSIMFGGQTYFEYYYTAIYSLLAMSTVSVTEYTNIVVIK